jgi:hypothetical protein
MNEYRIAVEIMGRDPNGLREQCEAALPATIRADSEEAAQRNADELFRQWADGMDDRATGLDAISVSVTA